METVGFIGVGNMGSGISANIQKAGYPMVVYDVRKEATKPLLDGGARLANSPAEVARLSQIIFTSLPGPKEVEEVSVGSEGILGGIKRGGVYVDLSTNRPTLIRQIEARYRQKGTHVLDAPVSGGKSGAASGNLAVMVGGEQEVYEQIKPLLDSFGDKVFYAGSIGAGSIAKLVHNMIGATVRQAIAEGLTLGVKAGVEAKPLWECVRRGALGRMRTLHEDIPLTVFPGQFEPAHFSLGLSLKDITLATELGHEYAVPLPMASLAKQTAIHAMSRGWEGMDTNVIFCLQEEAAGVKVRADGVDPKRASRFISTHPELD